MSTSRTTDWCAVGFDPGATGGFGVLTPEGLQYACTLDTKCLSSVYECLDLLPDEPVKVAIGLESVHGRWGWGAKSIFGLGGAFWVVKAALLDAGLDFIELVPVRWQKEVFLFDRGPKGKERKRAIIDAAEREWPEWDFRSGEADALWIARRVAVERGWLPSKEE